MPAVTVLNGAPLRRIEVDKAKVQMDSWPYTIPAVRDLVERGFEPSPGLTILVENGSGEVPWAGFMTPR
jgi:predicted ATPase